MTRIVLVLAFLAGAAADVRAESFRVTGVTLDSEARPVQGRNVSATFSYDSCTAAGACTPVVSGIWYMLSGADGRFDITGPIPAKPNQYAKNQKLVVNTYGSEASVYSKRSVAWNATAAFWTIDVVIRNAPAQVSPDGGYWARKIGCGEYPVFVVEGFDPGDSMKTGDRSEPRSWLGLLAASPLPGGGNLLDYLTQHNYSLYLLTSGAKSANSIKSDPSGDVTKGMAYQAMHLAKTIRDQQHPGKPVVVGGYSAGGLTARVGLNKWCDGTYAGVSGGFLAAGCTDVSLWFSGDAPQDGANVPISLQRYMHDDEITGDIPAATVIKGMLDAPAAQEMLRQSIGGQQECNTNCAGADMFGCESTDPHFNEECEVRTATHDTFMDWVGGFPTRAGGGAVPAIAFSLGQAWKDASGVTPKPDYCWDAAAGRGRKYFENDVSCWGNHNLYVDTAGGTNECVPGSVINSLLDFRGTTGEVPWCPGSYEIQIPFAPTYIPTGSALDWDNRDTRWNDYWYEDDNRAHGGGIPATAGGFLLAWITEYTTGLMDAPLCPGAGGPAAKTLGRRGICRSGGGSGAESTLACPLAVEPLQALVATHADGTSTPAVGVLRTTNFGAASPTYAPNNAGLSGLALDVHGLELDRFDSDIAYAYTADGIYRNPAVWGTGSWTQILSRAQFEAAAGMTFPAGWSIVHAIPSPTVQGRIHAIVEGRKGTIEPVLEKRFQYFAMMSANDGASWTAQKVGQSVGTAISGVTAGAFSITPSPTDPAKVWLTTWASNFSTCVWFTSCSTLWRSTDGGATWTENLLMRFPYTRTTHLLIPPTGNDDSAIGWRFRAPVGFSDPTFEVSADGLTSAERKGNMFTAVGASWANSVRRANSFYADPENGRIVVLSKNVFLFTNDSGKTWVPRTAPGIGNGDILERGPASWKIVAAASYSPVWNPSMYTTIAYTTDLGTTWQKRNGNLKDMTTAQTMSISAVRLRP